MLEIKPNLYIFQVQRNVHTSNLIPTPSHRKEQRHIFSCLERMTWCTSEILKPVSFLPPSYKPTTQKPIHTTQSCKYGASPTCKPPNNKTTMWLHLGTSGPQALLMEQLSAVASSQDIKMCYQRRQVHFYQSWDWYWTVICHLMPLRSVRFHFSLNSGTGPHIP